MERKTTPILRRIQHFLISLTFFKHLIRSEGTSQNYYAVLYLHTLPTLQHTWHPENTLGTLEYLIYFKLLPFKPLSAGTAHPI
jgi:hypothetical protein